MYYVISKMTFIFYCLKQNNTIGKKCDYLPTYISTN